MVLLPSGELRLSAINMSPFSQIISGSSQPSAPSLLSRKLRAKRSTMSMFPKLCRPLSRQMLRWLCVCKAIYCKSILPYPKRVMLIFHPAMASPGSTLSSAAMFTRIYRASGTSCDIVRWSLGQRAWRSILRLAEQGQRCARFNTLLAKNLQT
jgi:hypothetical protein